MNAQQRSHAIEAELRRLRELKAIIAAQILVMQREAEQLRGLGQAYRVSPRSPNQPPAVPTPNRAICETVWERFDAVGVD